MFQETQQDKIKPFLTDASNFSGGQAEGVAYAENVRDVQIILKEATHKKTPVYISGNGGGLVGGRCPLKGWVLATDHLNKILKWHEDPSEHRGSVTVESAIRLCHLKESAGQRGWFYAPDPTEQQSFIGATLATNASGPRSFKYGATRENVEGLQVILAGGECIELKRNDVVAQEGILRIPTRTLEGEDKVFTVPVPTYQSPEVKNASGFFASHNMDAVDLFIGSEGSLGVITQATLTLRQEPASKFQMLVFFETEEGAWSFAEEARERSLSSFRSRNDASISASAIEYFDSFALQLINDQVRIPSGATSAIFIEQETQAEIEDYLIDQWFILQENHRALSETTVVADNPEEFERLRMWRHLVPEAVRDYLRMHGQQKIGTDFAVPSKELIGMLRYQRDRVKSSGLLSVTFGHIGDGHVHLNLLPRNDKEAQTGWALYRDLLASALERGGTVSAEHGIGKIKKEFLEDMVGTQGILEMRQVKEVLDPAGILSPGNLFN